MATTLPITNKLAVTPLFDIQTAAFADTSAKGLWSALYGDYEGVKPLPDSYLVENLKRDASKGMLNRQQAGSLPYLGFYFGMVRSGILVPHTGQFRPDATAVVTFTHCDTKHRDKPGMAHMGSGVPRSPSEDASRQGTISLPTCR